MVLETIQVSLDSTLGWDLQDYALGTLLGEQTGPESGPAELPGSVGRVDMVFAQPTLAGPPLLGIATGSSVELGAASTAEAMTFLTPYLFQTDPGAADQTLSQIRSATHFPGVLQFFSTNIAAGANVIRDPRLPEILKPLIEELPGGGVALSGVGSGTHSSPAYPGVVPSNVPNSLNPDVVRATSLHPGFPRDLTLPESSGLDHLIHTPSVLRLDGQGRPIWRILYDANSQFRLFNGEIGIDFLDRLNQGKDNPVDWIAALYEINPTQTLLDTPNKVLNLHTSNTRVYSRFNPFHLSRAGVPSAPLGASLNLYTAIRNGLLQDPVKQLYDNLFNTEEELKSAIRVLAHQPGMYMIRSFNGA